MNKPISVDITQMMANATALYVNKPNAYVRNVKTYITPERDITPILSDGFVIVPVLFFVNSIGAVVEQSSDDVYKIVYGNKEVCLKVDEKALFVNGDKIALPVPASIIKGMLYAPITELCDAFGLYLFNDHSGVIVYSTDALNLSWTTHMKSLRKLSESYVYDDVEGSEITALLKQNFPNNKHPRLLMTEEKFSAIRTEYLKGEGCDPVYKILIEALREKCDAYLETKPKEYRVEPPYYLIDIGRHMNDRIMGLAMLYNITLDERYAERARQELIAATEFPNWNQTFMLACAEMTVGVAFGYDWLYNWLDENDRNKIRKSLVDYALAMVQNDYDNVTIACHLPISDNVLERAFLWRMGKPTNNQIIVINGAMFSTAAAIADELSGDELKMAERTFSQSLIDLRRGLSLFAPDGGYEESMGYWEFCQEFCTYQLGTLLNITGGKDYGYFDAPGIRNMVDFLIGANGPISTFSYHDTTTTVADFPPQTMFWADVLNNHKNALPRIAHIIEGKGKLEDLYFYKPEFRNTKADSLPLDCMYPTVGIASMRSGWEKNDLWVGFHSDNAYGEPGHAHMDAGNFVMDAMGHQYFLDFGQDSYGLDRYYLHVYRFRAEGHNTLVINPGDGYDQKFGGKACINQWVSNSNGVFAQTDLTDIYSEHVESARRGIKLDNKRTRVILQDEIVMKSPSEFYWFAHTAADIKIDDDGKKAYLSIEGDVLCAEIINGDGAQFSVMDAKPLPSTPDVPGQNPNKGVRKLTIHIPECEKLNLSVVFYPYGKDKGDVEFIPLEMWRIPD